jgi:DNA-binding response OmpR family regulator
MSAPSSERPRLAGVRVLVVDDDEDTCDVIAILLSYEGAAVSQARSAADALLLAAEPFDVMIVDIQMPRQSGVDFMSQARAVVEVPAIAMSAAFVGGEDMSTLRATGFTDAIRKPIEPEVLVPLLERIVRR